MSNEQVAPETKGVTVKLLAAVDLGPEIEGMAGRQPGPKAEAGRKKDHVQNPKPRRVWQHGHVDYREGE